ncbi:MAG: DMT family transporter [Burkholderiaceae bacterium]|nr:DMT family transporter [Burkholderiaceae bacterium]
MTRKSGNTKQLSDEDPATARIFGASSIVQTALLTCLALLAFASNSILCRLALMEGHIDPLSFTTLRLISGALVLYMLVRFRSEPVKSSTSVQPSTPIRQFGSWAGAVALFLYAITFSLAYIKMETGVGALILFSTVQLTMLLYGVLKGERLTLPSLVGLFISIAGLVYLLLPGSSAPPLESALLMTVAGAAWGCYSLLGKGAIRPLATTASNFARAIPLSVFVTVPFFASLKQDELGVLFAVLSGAFASALGYAVWYSVIRQLSVFKASSVQLCVPILTALIGTTFLGETLTLRIVLACIAVLGGIALVLVSKQRMLG